MSEMTICTVASCDRPSDGWFVCQRCADIFVNEILGEIGWILEDLDLVISKQVRYGQRVGGKSAETPLPINMAASDAKGRLLMELDTGARMIAEANDIEPEHSDGLSAAAWLAYRVSMIRLHPAGNEVIEGVGREFANALWVCDRPSERQYLGDCKDHPRPDGEPECPGAIYGLAGKPEARCNTCGLWWDADELKSWLLGQLDDRVMSAAEIARLSTYLGLDLPREGVRKLINKWHERRAIVAHRTADGVPLFRFGDVLDRLRDREVSKRTRHAKSA